MKKSDIRHFFKQLLLEKSKYRWQQTLRSVDQAIWLAWSIILAIVAFVTNNGGILLFIIWMVLGGFIVVYFFIAKGK